MGLSRLTRAALDRDSSRPVLLAGLIQDGRLADIYRDLREFSVIANQLRFGGEKLQPEAFQQFISSVQYRLMQLRGTLDGVVAESFRLGMLAFITTAHIQIPGVRLRYDYLAERLKECCCAIEPSTSELQRLLLWLLTMAAISMFDVGVPWLFSRLTGIVDRLSLSWKEAQAVLEDILWVKVVHDTPASEIFARLQAINVSEILVES
jgi:hypothetical protein